jgi:hypothetical protein
MVYMGLLLVQPDRKTSKVVAESPDSAYAESPSIGTKPVCDNLGDLFSFV